MLSSIMHSISSQTDHYGKHLWMFRISGNVLEICIQPKYMKDPEMFRQSVIHIGQVLQAINRKVTLNGYKTMIQSLPSLHEKHLIAIVRLRKNEGDSRPKEKTVISPGKPVVTLLNSLATGCGMFLKQLPQKKKAMLF